MTREWSVLARFEAFRSEWRRAQALFLVVVLAVVSLTLVSPARADAAASSSSATVVVNEFAVASSLSSADSFFELRNVTASPVDLTGWAVFRCDERGLRAKIGRPEVSLYGVILAPGEIFLATQMSAQIAVGDADARFSQVFSQGGAGLVLVNPAGDTVDAMAMYPNLPWPTQSECAPTPNLSAALSAALNESWQRTDAGEWVRAQATAGQKNRQKSTPTSSSPVRIDEIAAAGPQGSADDFVELRNTGTSDVDLSGWSLYRCTATGAMTPASLQVEFRDQVLLAGERLLIAGPGYVGVDVPDVWTQTSLADAVSGVALVTDDGARVDGVTLSEHADTACQTGDDKLGSARDYRLGHSWQRTRTGSFVVAPRTPGRENVSRADAVTTVASKKLPSAVLISEFATDPVISPAPSGVDRSNFVELANFSGTAHDIGGWRLYACRRDGFLAREPLAVVPSGTTLRPGMTWMAALKGTQAAASADAIFTVPFHFQGAGVWLEDADGQRHDGVGAFHVNEMDRSVDTPSDCSSGLALPVFAVDRLLGESYQRTQQTGDNMRDFTTASATPGLFEQPTPVQLEMRAAAVASELAPESLRAAALLSKLPASAGAVVGSPLAIVEAYAGRSSVGPLEAFVGEGEQALTSLEAGATTLAARDEGYDFPYVRFSVAVDSAPARVHWSGETLGRSEVRFAVWNETSGVWRQLDSASGTVDRLVEQQPLVKLQLSGEIGPEEVVGGAAWLLVQVVPRSGVGLTASEELDDPADYDFAVTHLTDTQYLTEAYPEVYADLVGWVVGSAAQRKIAFSTHTGDLVQNWVDPDQTEDRARHEFEIASRMQSVLDDAGVPNSVLPGNHDSKRGITLDLFNEYFGPERYERKPWYGGSIAPADNSANFSTFTAGGAPMLMLSLPYAYGEREIVWAEEVVKAHPFANIIVSTHEHLTPKGVEHPVGRSNSSRWVSRADQLWERVIAPNRNVVVVLSGHFHGLGGIVTENAGGIPGHTVLEALADYQEFRTHSGERATGFARLLQFDLGGGRVSVDALSPTLGAANSFPYDYQQFVRDNGSDQRPSNDRPWRVLAEGLQHRYTAVDDHFTVDIALQYPKMIKTSAILVEH